MSEAIQQADELRSRAIGLLLTERNVIDERLTLLGHDGTAPNPNQSSGRKTKACLLCGNGGHAARACPNKQAGDEPPATRSV
jgi:hypothetical protein